MNHSICKKILLFLCCGLITATCVNAQEIVVSDSSAWSNGKPKVNVLFGKQSPESVIQSISTVEGDKLLNRPVFNMANSLYGTLTGLNVRLSGGNPSSQLNYSLRGSTPLVIVDGVPRSSINVPLEQIESVSVIKDALGTSMLGMMAGGGVISIITKKGINQKLKVNFTAQFANNEQLFRPKFLQSSDYATLLNEALANDNKPLYFSQNDIEKYKSGSDPYLYPDIDWYDYILKSSAAVQKYNLNFNGGGPLARYYVDINYFDQGGFIKQDKSINTYDTQDSWKKYSMRTKIDVDLTPATYFEVNMFGQMFRENTPGVTLSTIYSDLANTPSAAYSPLNPDGSLGGNRIYKNNLYGATMKSGYYLYNSTDLSLDLRLTQDLSKFLKGAYVSALYTYNSIYRETLNRSKTRVIYGYSKDANGEDSYNQLTTSGTQANSSSYNRQNRMVDFEFDFGYNFTSGKHTSTNKIVYTNINYLIQNNLPFINQGVAGRFQYDYDKRYFAELTTSYYGMNQFKEGNQWGLFPAFGIGWNIAGENWFKDKCSAVDLLKLRASYGKSGDNLAAAYFESAVNTPAYYYDYQYYYLGGDAVYFGNSASSSSTLMENKLPYLSQWNKVKSFNLGVDAALLNNKLNVSA